MSTVVVRGQEYTYYVERDLVIAFAVHHAEDSEAGGSAHLIAVEPIFASSNCEEFKGIEGYTTRVTFIPASRTALVTATVTNLKTKASREFELGLDAPGARLDIHGEIVWRIEQHQIAAEKRAVQS